VAELLEVSGDESDRESPLVHFIDWPPVWDQRVAVISGRLRPLRSASRGYTGPPSLANKEGVKESFERRVAEKMAQQYDEVSGAAAGSAREGAAERRGEDAHSAHLSLFVSLCPLISRCQRHQAAASRRSRMRRSRVVGGQTEARSRAKGCRAAGC
jgi:hypothetical protein